MNMVLQHAAKILTSNGLITAFLFAGIVFFISNVLTDKLTRGRIHPSAVAIFLGLAAAYIGGSITGGEKGLADVTLFGGLGVLGGSYGGYMTNWIIGHTDRFAAAVSQRSFC